MFACSNQVRLMVLLMVQNSGSCTSWGKGSWKKSHYDGFQKHPNGGARRISEPSTVRWREHVRLVLVKTSRKILGLHYLWLVIPFFWIEIIYFPNVSQQHLFRRAQVELDLPSVWNDLIAFQFFFPTLFSRFFSKTHFPQYFLEV